MASPDRCPTCGVNLPANAPAGVCPRCLMQMGLDGPALSLSHPGTPGATVSLAGDTVLHKLSASIGPVPRVLLRDTTQGDATSPVVQPSSPEMPDARPDRLQLFGEIARGGMGAILKGRDPDLGRDLAVKVLLERHGGDPDLVRRFIEEAQIAGQLQHPGIAPVYELGAFADARPYFTMKLVKGRTLAEMLAARGEPGRVSAGILPDPTPGAKENPRAHAAGLASDLPRFLTIFEAIAQTVAYAHARGVIHRDLKPSNVMVGSFGEVQVMDWGLAKVLPKGGVVDDAAAGKIAPQETVIATARSGSDDPNLSQPGSIMGTPAYMAPEQARGETSRVDERADVFALGSILCEVLTGEPAFTGRSSGEIQRKAALGDTADALGRVLGEPGRVSAGILFHPAPGAKENPGAHAAGLAKTGLAPIDPELAVLCRDCLAREPEDRPRDASAVADRVASYLAGVQEKLRRAELETVEANARAESEGARAEAERSKRRLAVGLAASILLAGLIGGGSWTAFRLDRDARRNESDRLVGDALATAKALQTVAERAGPEALDAWVRALDAADRAKGLLVARPPRAALAADVATTYDAVAKSAADARARTLQLAADRRLVAELDEARLQGAAAKDGRFDSGAKLAAYAAAFRGAGVDFGEQPAEEIVARLKPKRDIQQIAAALDDWAWYGAARKKLSHTLDTVAGVIDPERNPLRAAIRKRDRAALAAMARTPTSREMPANTACLLAKVLDNLGSRDDAIALLAAARSGSPADFWINHDLGLLFHFSEKTPADRVDAVRFLTVAAALKPDSPGTLVNLGAALAAQGKPAEAIAAYREAIRLNPDDPVAHYNLGAALAAQGKPAEAIAAYREAIRLKPDYVKAHSNLGNALNDHGKLVESLAAYREAIRLKPDLAEAHCNLGQALGSQGRYTEALAELRKGHELGSKQVEWRYPSAQWVAYCEAMVALEARLPALLRGDDSPKDNAERLALGQLGYDTKRFATSARFWGEALAHDPKLADDRKAGRRYNAACSAAMAGTGGGVDDPKPDDAARAKLRDRARDWLRAELSAWKAVAMTVEPGNETTVANTLKHWKGDADLAGVRDADALAKLPEAERADWRALWDEVDALLQKAGKDRP